MDDFELKATLEVLGAMTACEEAMAGFYLACAGRWKEEAPFWLARAGEEEQHAAAISRMVELLRSRPYQFLAKKAFRPEAVHTFAEFIARQTSLIKEGETSHPRAVVVARSIEESLIENHFEEIARSDDPEFNALLVLVTHGCVLHRQALEKKGTELAQAPRPS
jgi:hypothetical protein